MWPSPIRGPQPQTGSIATSRRPTSSPIAGNRSVSPGKYTVREPAMTQPIAGPVGPERLAAAGMVGVHDLEPDAVDRQAVAGLDLLDRAERRLLRDPPEPLGDDQRGLARDPAQGREVEVVVVAVADEHRVEVGEQLRQHGLDLPPHRADALAQHGIGEDPQVVDLDQHRRVAEERQPAALGGVGIRPRGRGGPDGTPALVDVSGSVGHAPMVPHRIAAGADSGSPRVAARRSPRVAPLLAGPAFRAARLGQISSGDSGGANPALSLAIACVT